MSQKNVELVRRAVLGWNERGVDALIDVLDPEVEFHPPRESMEPGVYRGHAGVRDYFGRLAEVFDEQRVQSVEVIDVDEERVIAVVRGFGKSPNFAAEVELNWAWLVTARGGRATYVETFTDRAQALSAAGVSASTQDRPR